MISKTAITSAPIHTLIQNRWSPRAFAADRALNDDAISSLLEAARWAPSCMNEQPWRFVIGNRFKSPETWQTLLHCLAEKNQQWAQHAPVLILTLALDHFSQNGKPNRWAAYDLGAASMSLTLQATALGLVSHQMGGFDVDRCRELLHLPADCTPYSVIAVGYQAEDDQLSEEFQQRERAERSRLSLEQIGFFERWD